MKAVILAGGLGSRLSEETERKPKPMVEVGGRPILWHIMKMYSHFGIDEFVVCCGYKGFVIKEYFVNYAMHNSSITVDMATGHQVVHSTSSEPWGVTLVDTGDGTGTAGRLSRVREHLGDEPFCFTYGDGVSDVDIAKLIEHHETAGRLLTVTAVLPPNRYGVIRFEEDGGTGVKEFQEKPSDNAWINGGFFVVDPKVLDLVNDDSGMFEDELMRRVVREGQLNSYRHHGFWQCMDTLREKNLLEEYWNEGKAPWKHWE